jgi:hypothetical protein
VVKSVLSAVSGRSPLYPQKRTSVERVGMSALCQKRHESLRCSNKARRLFPSSDHSALNVINRITDCLEMLQFLIGDPDAERILGGDRDVDE